MGLSAHEKRLLEEIEQTLDLDRPHRAAALGRTRPRGRAAGPSVGAGLASRLSLLLTGLIVLLLGVHADNGVGVVVGVIGYVVIVAAVGCRRGRGR